MVSKMMLMISEIAGTKTHNNFKHESITERQIQPQGLWESCRDAPLDRNVTNCKV